MPSNQTLALILLECAAIMAPTCEPDANGEYSAPVGVSPFICDNLIRPKLWKASFPISRERDFARDFIRALGILPNSTAEFDHIGDPSTAYSPARQCARVAFLLFASDLAAEWGDDLCREIIAEAGR